MKYFSIFDKNVPTIFQLQWNMENISDIFLQYSVLRWYLICLLIILNSSMSFRKFTKKALSAKKFNRSKFKLSTWEIMKNWSWKFKGVWQVHSQPKVWFGENLGHFQMEWISEKNQTFNIFKKLIFHNNNAKKLFINWKEIVQWIKYVIKCNQCSAKVSSQNSQKCRQTESNFVFTIWKQLIWNSFCQIFNPLFAILDE